MPEACQGVVPGATWIELLQLCQGVPGFYPSFHAVVITVLLRLYIKDKVFVHWNNIQTDDRFPRLQQGMQPIPWKEKLLKSSPCSGHVHWTLLRVEFGLVISQGWMLGREESCAARV